jgi:hypothetical protein
MCTLVRLHEEGVLSIFEPRAVSLPIEWHESVTPAIAHLRLHNDVAESVGLRESVDFASMRQSCFVCSRADQASSIFMERAQPSSATDSGWFIGCTDDNHDHQRDSEVILVSLFEAGNMDDRVIPYLALPAGASVDLGPSVPGIFYRGSPVAIEPGSYLDGMMSRGHREDA